MISTFPGGTARPPDAIVEQHYARGGILDSILAGLRAQGKDTARLEPEDLAPVDEFHIRGREATVELARRAALRPGLRVLDVGSGLGGSARYLASEYHCQVIGVDLTQEYVDAAASLADLVGLHEQVSFRQGSALQLPFADETFDVAWTEHVQMNIADKHAFYGQLSRVLRPGGTLLFHDIFSGSGDALDFPVPWAERSSISFLAPPAQIREILEDRHFQVLDWEDSSALSLQWLETALGRARASGPPPIGIHLLMGPSARQKLENLAVNLRTGRVVVCQGRAIRA